MRCALLLSVIGFLSSSSAVAQEPDLYALVGEAARLAAENARRSGNDRRYVDGLKFVTARGVGDTLVSVYEYGLPYDEAIKLLTPIEIQKGRTRVTTVLCLSQREALDMGLKYKWIYTSNEGKHLYTNTLQKSDCK